MLGVFLGRHGLLKGAKDILCIFLNYSRVEYDLWDSDLNLGAWCHSQLQFLSSVGLYY